MVSSMAPANCGAWSNVMTATFVTTAVGRSRDEKNAGDLVQKEWRGDLHSRKGRDVMHLIMSARAGTDVEAFEGAARDFLAEQFAGHRYVFAMHDPANDPKEEGEGGKRPHVHAHAIITMRSESGDRIETTPAGVSGMAGDNGADGPGSGYCDGDDRSPRVRQSARLYPQPGEAGQQGRADRARRDERGGTGAV